MVEQLLALNDGSSLFHRSYQLLVGGPVILQQGFGTQGGPAFLLLALAK